MSEPSQIPTITVIGDSDIDVGEIRSVGIQNIALLKSYTISSEDNRIMHVGEFSNGGSFEMTFTALDRVEILSGNNVTIFRRGTSIIFAQSGTTSDY